MMYFHQPSKQITPSIL